MTPLERAAIPAALRGPSPRWWDDDASPLVAAGPFGVEYGGLFRVGVLLRPIEGEPGVYGYSDGDREHLFAQARDAVVRGNVLVVPAADGPVLFRPLRESDVAQIPGLPPGESIAARVRLAFDW